MRRRRNREVQIFSMSAIDLFAAAMSAFALLTVVLIPDYQKTVKERTPEFNIDDEMRAAEESSVEAEIKRKALEAKVEAAKANLSDIESEAKKKLAEMISAESIVAKKKAEAERVIEPPKPIASDDGPTEKKSVVSFRFLGMKTNRSDIQLALDLNTCMGGHEQGYNDAVRRIIDSLQPHHNLSITGFHRTNAGPQFQSWPSSRGQSSMDSSGRSRAESFATGLSGRFDGGSNMLSAFDRLLAQPGEAIFLVSDGWPNPAINSGLHPLKLVEEITRRNDGKKEIHTVIIGSYFKYPEAVEFMQRLARNNNGQFMALASANRGACD